MLGDNQRKILLVTLGQEGFKRRFLKSCIGGHLLELRIDMWCLLLIYYDIEMFPSGLFFNLTRLTLLLVVLLHRRHVALGVRIAGVRLVSALLGHLQVERALVIDSHRFGDGLLELVVNDVEVI